MKKLCFGSFATVLVKCKAPTTTQKQLIGTMLLSVNSIYDICDDDGGTSALALGRVNLSENVTLYVRDVEPQTISKYFKEKILPLLDLNRRATMILALKDIIAHDSDITDDRELELVNKLTKAEIITRDTFVFEDFLAGLFLYIAIYTSNNKREQNVREITDAYINGFDARRNEISFVLSYGIGNMDVLNEAAADARTLSLMAEEEGHCPCCAKPLSADGSILIELGGGIDYLLCTACAPTVRNSPEKKAELAALKTTLQDRVTARDAVASNRLPDDIRELISIISTGEPITESELRMSPLRVEQKISDKLLLRKVKGYVIDGMYEMVNEAIEQLAASNRLNVRQFERSIKRMYEDAEDSISGQSEIFKSLVNYLFAKSGQKSYEACEILISYFVQRCEVFHEITG